MTYRKEMLAAQAKVHARNLGLAIVRVRTAAMGLADIAGANPPLPGEVDLSAEDLLNLVQPELDGVADDHRILDVLQASFEEVFGYEALAHLVLILRASNRLGEAIVLLNGSTGTERDKFLKTIAGSADRVEADIQKAMSRIESARPVHKE